MINTFFEALYAVDPLFKIFMAICLFTIVLQDSIFLSAMQIGRSRSIFGFFFSLIKFFGASLAVLVTSMAVVFGLR